MKRTISSYLRSLKFNPKLWNTLQARYLLNFRLVILLIICVVMMGIMNYLSIPRRLNPEVKIPIVTVISVLPGANPKDVESLVTVPIEDKLNGVKGLDTMTSTSSEGSSAIVLQFLSNVDSEKARSDVQALVDTVNLPADVKNTTVKALDFQDEPIWDFVVKGNTDVASLMKFSKVLTDRIENISKVDRVVTGGINQQEIDVVIDPIKIREYNISPLQISQAVVRGTNSYPSGTVSTGSSTISLSIDQQLVTIEDIRNMHINAQGQLIRLSDIASISESAKHNQQSTFFATKTSPTVPAVEFFVYKTSSSNIDEAGKEIKAVVDKTVVEYGNRFQVVNVLNTSDEIAKQFSSLISEFRSTILLVFINLFLFLGLRQAFISSLTIPLTFFSAISIINIMGLTLNFLTSFAFLIALGLLIDDTIVTVAAMTRYYSTGKFTPAETGLLVWKDFIVPLWSTTITTIWAFVPLLLATGIIGEFIKPIPIVVTATLLSSTTIAVLITIPLMIIILKPDLPMRVQIFLRVLGFIVAAVFIYFLLPKSVLLPFIAIVLIIFVYVFTKARTSLIALILEKTAHFKWRDRFIAKTRSSIDHGLINTEILSYRYMKIIDKILLSPKARKQTLIALISFAVIAYMLVPLGFVVNEFFPKSDQDIIYIGVELPANTAIETTAAEAKSLLNEVKKTEGTEFVVARTGATPPSGFSGSGQASNNFLLTLHLLPAKQRISSIELAEKLRKQYQGYSIGKLSVVELSGGPPAGADVQIKLLGDDLQVLNEYADKIQGFLEKQPGLNNVNVSIKPGTSKLVFVPDQLKLAEVGLTADAVSTWLRTYAAGFNLDTLKVENKDTDIVLRMSSSELTPEDIGSISIPTTSTGTLATPGTTTTVPLLSLGSMHLETNPTVITRENGKRTISVAAAIRKGYSTTIENKKLEQFANSLNLPGGYSWQTGGVNEENQKSVQSILSAMVISILLILVTMVIEFRSFRQALIVILVIPLAIPGVFYIFALTGTPLSFPALIGVLALFGIVVTNAIVVVEKINDNRREGMMLREAIVDASGSRLEPILLTSVTSILGLIPITLSDPLWRGLGGAIISGLLFSGLIKLFFVPVVYYLWYKTPKDDEYIVPTVAE